MQREYNTINIINIQYSNFIIKQTTIINYKNKSNIVCSIFNTKLKLNNKMKKKKQKMNTNAK